MPTQKYLLKDGREVPGASTIAKIGDDQTGLRNASIDMALKKGLDSRIEWKKDTDIGTAVHGMIEQYIKHLPIVPMVEGAPIIDEFVSRTAWLCFRGWEAWFRTVEAYIVETEVALVSEEERFGGTFDALLKKDNKLWIADWKTSRSFYDNMGVQVSGYRAAWNENHPSQLVEGGLVLRISKDSGRAIPRWYSKETLDECWSHFKIQRDLHESKKRVSIALKEYNDA